MSCPVHRTNLFIALILALVSSSWGETPPVVSVDAIHVDTSNIGSEKKACWAPSFQPINNIQIGGTVQENNTELLNTLLNITRTILDILQSQPQPAPKVPCRPRDCSEILSSGVATSGVYDIFIEGNEGPIPVYCDMETDGGGWTVFQRRQDGSLDFFLGWYDYKQGFGNVSAEHWLGNDNIHRLTSQKNYELRIDLEDFELQTRHARYGLFNIADKNDNYRLTIGEFSGDAGDGLISQSGGQAFSTKDRDNDPYYTNCAALFTGAWWYGECHDANLNGQYLRGQTSERAKGAVWQPWLGHFYSLKKTEMKVRAL